MTEKEISSFISKIIHNIYYGELKKEQYVYLPFKTGNLIRNGLNRKFDAKQGHWEIYLDDSKVDYANKIDSKMWGKGWFDNITYPEVEAMLRQALEYEDYIEDDDNKGWKIGKEDNND